MGFKEQFFIASKGKTIGELSKLLNVGSTTISRWGMGLSEPHPSMQKLVLEILNSQSE